MAGGSETVLPIPEVSVVVPFRNAAWCLGTQLDALALQRPDCAWELILVENGSSDDWPTIVAAHTVGFPVPVRVLQIPAGPGPGHAYNAGVVAAAGRWVAACDADDRVDPHWLASLLALAAPNRMVSGSCRMWDGSDGACHAPLWNSAAGSHLGGPPVVLSGNLLLSRALFLELGGFRADYVTAEDCELSWRAWGRGVELTPAWKAVIDYRSRPDLGGILRQKIRQGRDDMRLVADYRGRVPLNRRDPAAPRWRFPLRSLLLLMVPGVSAAGRRHGAERIGKWIGHAMGRWQRVRRRLPGRWRRPG
jgi:glycosyltransferase involved in cell wall biosynthesis